MSTSKLLLGVALATLATAQVRAQDAQAGEAAEQDAEAREDPEQAAQTSADAAIQSSEAEADGGALAEILVVAQRRSESLQRVPISISVISNDELESQGISGIQDIKIAAPGVEVQSNHNYAMPIIRGVGSRAFGPGIETPISIYVDGVYYAAATGNLFQFNNISQIEVLKGPQGTLFGRNATGGLLHIITRDPEAAVGGRANLSVGNYGTWKADAYITGGITSALKADLAAVGTIMSEGYGTNFFNNEDAYRTNRDWAVRSKWVFEPGPNTTLRFIGDYGESKHSNNAQRVGPGEAVVPPFGPNYGGSPWDIDADEPFVITVDTGGVSLQAEQRLHGIDVVSTTAYRHTNYFVGFDFDYTRTRGRFSHYRQVDRQFTQELQIRSADDGRLNWMLGAFYLDARGHYPSFYTQFVGVAALPAGPSQIVALDLSAAQATRSIAGFGQSTLELFSDLRVTAGLRYTSEKRSLEDAYSYFVLNNGGRIATVPEGAPDRHLKFNELTWRLALDYQATPETLLYVSYNRGFKSGGFNATSLLLAPFEPETIDAYEVGAKTRAFNGRVRASGALYYYDYRDIQVNRVVNGATGIYNGAAATIYGLELDLDARISSPLTVSAGYQYAHGEYDEFPGAVIATPDPITGAYLMSVGDVSGNKTILTPRHSLSLAGTYTVDLARGQLDFNASGYYNSGYFHEPDNTINEPEYILLNASVELSLPSGFSASIWGKNLTNTAVAYIKGVQSFGALGHVRAGYAPPRTYGLTIGYEF